MRRTWGGKVYIRLNNALCESRDVKVIILQQSDMHEKILGLGLVGSPQGWTKRDGSITLDNIRIVVVIIIERKEKGMKAVLVPSSVLHGDNGQKHAMRLNKTYATAASKLSSPVGIRRPSGIRLQLLDRKSQVGTEKHVGIVIYKLKW